jgi:hypothetical protein
MATTASIIGALLVASNTGSNLLGFFFYLVGSIYWVIYGIEQSNSQIVSMNSLFVLINLLGIWRNF